MLDYDTSALETACKNLFAALENQLKWKWDERFETVLAEFNVKEKAKVTKVINAHMGDIWDGGNVQQAPELIKLMIDFFGGLHPGQELYTTRTDRDDLLLCAWWPWGNGETISIRLGVYVRSLTDAENKQLSHLFKGWFGL